MKETSRKGFKKLQLWMPLAVHDQLKIAAVEEGVSITVLIKTIAMQYLYRKNQQG